MKFESIELSSICRTNAYSYSQNDNWQFVNYLDTGNITQNKISEIQHIDLQSEKLPSRAKRKVKHDSILFSTVRPNQLHYGIIKSQPENFLVSTGFAVIDIDETKAVADFIYYYLIQKDIIQHLQAIAEQSTSAYPSIKPSDIENLIINIPDLKTQSRIAAVLSALDDKIELNNKINENLEQQAQAIFKSWFVDFEPFGGVMPQDWKKATLNDVCKKITDGSHYSPKDDPSANIPMLSVKDMLSSGFSFQSCKHIDEDEFQKMIANDCVPLKNDILVAKDGSYLKEIFICNCKQRIAILSSIAIFRPNTEIIIPEILLALLKSPAVLQEVKDNYVSGSVLPRIVLKDFKKLRLILPSMKVQEQVAPILHNIRLQIDINCEENTRLSALRDTLLPKLMNGEIDVSAVKI